jgi:hypothetical protein
MKINPVGNYLEVSCSECGEALLIGSGDSVNLRWSESPASAPMPDEILCAVCGRKEGGGAEATIRFFRLVCSCCGGDMSADDPIPDFDENGDIKDFFCSECSEPWRRGECDPT